jgi:DNA helicase IV
MGRPKLPTTSAEISAQIARIQEESQAQVRQLEERRRVAEARENQRRGELLTGYLAGTRAADLRRILRSIVNPEDRELFGLEREGPPDGGMTGAPAATVT